MKINGYYFLHSNESPKCIYHNKNKLQSRKMKIYIIPLLNFVNDKQLYGKDFFLLSENDLVLNYEYDKDNE